MESKLKTLFYYSIFFLFPVTLQAQDWQLFGYEKLPGAEYMLNLHFLSSDTGWVVGQSGRIYKTLDGGRTWIDQSLAGDIKINQVQFLDEQNGYINTEVGIQRTADGGESWEIVNNIFTDLSSFAFNNVNQGWSIDKKGVYQTGDGGRTWELRSTAAAYQRFSSIYTLEPSHCLVGASVGWIRATNDGGQTWSIYQPLPGANWVNSIDFITGEKGYVKGYAKTRITTDGGVSVLPLELRTPAGSIDMINEQEGWIYNAVSRLHHTTDGGLNWEVQFESPFLDFSGGQFFENRTGWLVGENESVLKTTDGGERWEMNRINAPSFNAVEYIDTENSWAVGEEGVIYFKRITSPIWKRMESGSSLDFMDVAFLNPSKGWIIGEAGTLLVTTDAGQNWIEQALPVASTQLRAIKFFDNQLGVIVGQSGVIIRTSDQGANWTAIDPITAATLNDLSYTSTETIWAVGDSGTVLTSFDQGLNWQRENWSNTEHLKAVLFTSPTEGYIASTAGKVYRTMDSGDSWNVVLDQGGVVFNTISFSSPQHGIVAGSEGIIYRTEDGGNTWTKGNNQIKEDLQSVIYYDEISAWAVGKDGTIIKHVGDLTEVADHTPSQAIEFFPNPAHRSIQLKAPDSKLIEQVYIYDASGRLIEEKQAINENSISLDLTHYITGPYFIQLRIEGEMVVKKFIKE